MLQHILIGLYSDWSGVWLKQYSQLMVVLLWFMCHHIQLSSRSDSLQINFFVAALLKIVVWWPALYDHVEVSHMFMSWFCLWKVMESHQAGKKDASGTAKAVIECFQKLGVAFDMDQVGVPCAHWKINYLVFLIPIACPNPLFFCF